MGASFSPEGALPKKCFLLPADVPRIAADFLAEWPRMSASPQSLESLYTGRASIRAQTDGPNWAAVLAE